MGFAWASSGLLLFCFCWYNFGEFFMRSLRYFFIDSPGGGHLVGIGWASGEVCISLSILLNGALGILVLCWWWLVWTFGGLLPV